MEPSRLATTIVAVTPSDTENVDFIALRADSAGVIKIVTPGSPSTVTLNVVAGEIIPCLIRKVLTGTTATVHGFK